MRGLKIYLIVVTVLLIGALGFGVYVWYTLQTLENIADSAYGVPNSGTVTEEVKSEVEINTPPSGSVTVETNSLSEGQQKALEGLGYTKESITFTPAMIECARDAVGAERYEAILGGAAPTPLESLKLLPCFNAK